MRAFIKSAGLMFYNLFKSFFFNKKSIFVLCFICFLCVGITSDANARKHRSKRNKYAALVIEAKTGKILFERYARSRRYPASLTKMMTLYLTFQALESGKMRLNTRLHISKKAARQPASKLGLRAGNTIKVYDAIMSLVTQSANDVAVVLAEAMGGSTRNFARLMTKQARALGMKSTSFKNPSGLPDRNQYTTAYDMARLGHALIYHYPGFYPYFSRSSFRYRGKKYHNHNNLMKRYRGMDGIKTGYIQASGFNLVASVRRGNKRIIGVVFGGRKSKTRDRHMAKILNSAFRKIARKKRHASRRIKMPSKIVAIFKERRLVQKKKHSLKHAKLKLSAVTGKSMRSNFGGWGIQVGAYSEVKAAQNVLVYISSAFSSKLGKAEQSLQKITLRDGSSVYRARFTGLEQNTARSMCSYLINKGHGCLVITGP